MSVWQELHKEKEADLGAVIQAVLDAGEVPEELVEGVASADEDYRYNCYQVLVEVISEWPEIVYPAWDRFVGLLDSKNAFYRSAAVRILARLAPADTEQRLEPLFERLFEHLDDDKILVTRYLVQDAGIIARAKPDLQERVVAKLLSIDETHHKHKDLIKGDAIQSFETFFEEVDNKEEILAFVEDQLECSSPKTRKAAKAFLNKHGHGRT